MTAGPPLGAHMSIAGGLPEAVARARAVGATALQVFVKSSSQWRARPFAPGEAQVFRAAAAESGLAAATIAHSMYLVNLASPDAAIWRRSLEAFVEELDRCAELGIGALVVHPGSHMGAGEEAGEARVVEALEHALRVTAARPVRVLLEITAGQGRCLGGTFEGIARILDRARPAERLGACFDTCHALAAGYELRDRDSYERTMAELDRTIGIERVRAVHLNDSKTGLGSRCDRHEHIGRGTLGLEAFRSILNDPRLRDRPMVIETEKGKDLAEDRVNLGVLRSLLAPA